MEALVSTFTQTDLTYLGERLNSWTIPVCHRNMETFVQKKWKRHKRHLPVDLPRNTAWPGGSLHHPVHSNEEKTQCTAISSEHPIGRKLSNEDGMNSADCDDYSEGSQNSDNIQTSDAVAEEVCSLSNCASVII